MGKEALKEALKLVKFCNNGGRPFVARLNSQGFNSFAIEFSSSGTPNSDDLNIELDGRNLAFQSSGADDRSFYFFPFDEQLSSGPHQLKFRASPAASNPWLSNLTAFEFGENYNFAAVNVGTYPLFDKNLRVDGYRATHRSCLMRDMTKNYFCPVCQENNWIKFFSRISVIDSVSRQTTNNQQQVLTVTPLQPGQLRTGDQGRLRVTWSKDGQALEAFDDQFEIIVQNDAVTGSRIEVEVVYETPEVRRDSMNRLRDHHQWQF